MGNKIWYPIDARNFGSDVAHARQYRLWRRGRLVPGQPDGSRRTPFFLGEKSPGAFGQLALFLAENRMTIVALEKGVSLKAYASLFGKPIVRQY